MDDEKKYSQRDIDVLELKRGIAQISRTVSTIPKLSNDISNIRNKINTLELTYLTRQDYLDDKVNDNAAKVSRRKPIVDIIWSIVRNLSWVAVMFLIVVLFRNAEIITGILGVR